MNLKTNVRLNKEELDKLFTERDAITGFDTENPPYVVKALMVFILSFDKMVKKGFYTGPKMISKEGISKAEGFISDGFKFTPKKASWYQWIL